MSCNNIRIKLMAMMYELLSSFLMYTKKLPRPWNRESYFQQRGAREIASCLTCTCNQPVVHRSCSAHPKLHIFQMNKDEMCDVFINISLNICFESRFFKCCIQCIHGSPSIEFHNCMLLFQIPELSLRNFQLRISFSHNGLYVPGFQSRLI